MTPKAVRCLFCQRVVTVIMLQSLGTEVYVNHRYAGSTETCPGSGSVVPPEPMEEK